jgi:hypothetical protein
MLLADERWIGPFQIRSLLEHALDSDGIRPPEHGSSYLVTLYGWSDRPLSDSGILYVGGITGGSARFRTRIGDLIADMFGFFTSTTGHHSGGQHLNSWCIAEKVHPLDLYLSWVEGATCHRCLEVRMHRTLKPQLNRVVPARCRTHA